jgi:ankyrin repeat protein
VRKATDFGGAASREWAHIERGREGEGKATILLAPPEKLAAKRKRVSESADATARDACLRALAEGADAAAPDATGAAALLYLASINAPEAHEVMRKVIHDGTDLSVAHALDGKGPLDVALEAGNVWAVRALLSRGAAPLCAPSLTEGCCSLLEFATLHGFVRQAALALTQLLFSALDAADPGEAPPARRPRSGACRVLTDAPALAVVLAAVLSHGVSPNVRDSSGRTPLLRCIQGRSLGLGARHCL